MTSHPVHTDSATQGIVTGSWLLLYAEGSIIRSRSVFCPGFQSPFKTVRFITACGLSLAFWYIPAIAESCRVEFVACSQSILTDSAVGKEAPLEGCGAKKCVCI